MMPWGDPANMAVITLLRLEQRGPGLILEIGMESIRDPGV